MSFCASEGLYRTTAHGLPPAEPNQERRAVNLSEEPEVNLLEDPKLKLPQVVSEDQCSDRTPFIDPSRVRVQG